MSKKIAQALHDVMAKVGYVQKAKTNDFHKYKYAGEADLLAALRPAMVEAGLLLIPSVTDVRDIDEYGNTTIIMEYTLAHKDGDIWPTPIRIAGVGGDRQKGGGVGDKGLYKALTGANKYFLFKLFQIETGDDPEGDSGHERNQDKPAPKQTHTAGGITEMHPRTKLNEGKVLASNAIKKNPELMEKWKEWVDLVDGAVSVVGLSDAMDIVSDGMCEYGFPANWQNSMHERIDDKRLEIVQTLGETLQTMNPIAGG